MDWSKFIKIPDSVPSSGTGCHGREAVDRMANQLRENGTPADEAKAIATRCAIRKDTGENKNKRK